MKKKVLAFLGLIVFLSLGYSQTTPTLTQTSNIRFEDALAIKGQLFVKEFFPVSSDFDISFEAEISRLFFPESKNSYYALKLTTDYYKSKIDSGKTTVLLDESEIKSLITSINYMKQVLSNLTGKEPYTEAVYKSPGNFTFGFYASGAERKFFIEVNNKEIKFYYEERLGEIEEFFISVIAKIEELKKQTNAWR